MFRPFPSESVVSVDCCSAFSARSTFEVGLSYLAVMIVGNLVAGPFDGKWAMMAKGDTRRELLEALQGTAGELAT